MQPGAPAPGRGRKIMIQSPGGTASFHLVSLNGWEETSSQKKRTSPQTWMPPRWGLRDSLFPFLGLAPQATSCRRSAAESTTAGDCLQTFFILLTPRTFHGDIHGEGHPWGHSSLKHILKASTRPNESTTSDASKMSVPCAAFQDECPLCCFPCAASTGQPPPARIPPCPTSNTA